MHVSARTKSVIINVSWNKITEPFIESYKIMPWVNGEKPPNEEWVEVLSGNKTVMVAKAVYGRDGYLPHWQTIDGELHHPSKFNVWRRLPDQGEIYGK